MAEIKGLPHLAVHQDESCGLDLWNPLLPENQNLICPVPESAQSKIFPACFEVPWRATKADRVIKRQNLCL